MSFLVKIKAVKGPFIILTVDTDQSTHVIPSPGLSEFFSLTQNLYDPEKSDPFDLDMWIDLIQFQL